MLLGKDWGVVALLEELITKGRQAWRLHAVPFAVSSGPASNLWIM